MRVLDLFSGVGGMSLGLERAGMQTVAFCEIEPYCRAVLRKHWPDVPIYDDVRQLTAAKLKEDGIEAVDLVCGGDPCQPSSAAGKQLGEADPRHLWPQMLRIIRDVRPRWVIRENVSRDVYVRFDSVAEDLEGEGFAVWPFLIPACGVGSYQRRERLWVVAYSHRGRKLQPGGGVGQFGKRPCDCTWWTAEPELDRVAYGIPNGVDRIRALGNAIVPQIPEILGRAILTYDLAA